MNKQLNFPYEHVLVLGLAKSGTAAAQLLLANQKKVRVTDMKADESTAAIQELKELGAELILGEHPLSLLDGIEIIVKNPGIPYHIPILQEALKRKIPIVTEVELASRLVAGSMIGVTGSNGKTTTSTLIHQMLVAANQPAKLAGNIGTAATEVASEMSAAEKMVLELSSFQLLGTKTFRPHIAVLLNIYEAHLDYHQTMEHYQNAKFNIFANQTNADYLVFNADQDVIRHAVENAKAIKIPFSTKTKLIDGAWADQEAIYFKTEEIMKRKDIVLVGEHNLENILAAVSVAKLNNVENVAIKSVLRTFSGVKHRLQFITKMMGRSFYNDSKATNSLATEMALKSFDEPIILLAGGLDRGVGFEELIPALTNVKAFILFGETKQKLKEIAEATKIPYELVENVEEAAAKAYEISAEDDVILLSPACASWDQYPTFEVRGDLFIKAVKNLEVE